jgi:toxin YoeB
VTITFTESSWEEYLYWQETDQSKVERIHLLIREIKRHPFQGLGKPEPLKGRLAGLWSRRIDAEHRLVYRVERGELVVLQCRYHY